MCLDSVGVLKLNTTTTFEGQNEPLTAEFTASTIQDLSLQGHHQTYKQLHRLITKATAEEGVLGVDRLILRCRGALWRSISLPLKHKICSLLQKASKRGLLGEGTFTTVVVGGGVGGGGMCS
jgi:hypothetical protein